MYDCIVIGKGPCGISCAIYLKRFNLNVLVIAKSYGALEKAAKIENYYGFDSISGIELAKKGVNQALSLGIEIRNEEVLEINDLNVVTNKNAYSAKSIFLALGKSRDIMINGINDVEVSYCAICDGFFYRNKKIAIIGYGDYMLHEKEILEQYTKDITVFTNRNIFVENAINGVIERLFDDGVKHIIVGGVDYKFDQIFIANELNGFNLSKHLGLLTNKSNDVITKEYMTNIKGIFAGGDLIGGLNQIASAVSDGANAAICINKFLKEE